MFFRGTNLQIEVGFVRVRDLSRMGPALAHAQHAFALLLSVRVRFAYDSLALSATQLIRRSKEQLQMGLNGRIRNDV